MCLTPSSESSVLAVYPTLEIATRTCKAGLEGWPVSSKIRGDEIECVSLPE